MKLPLVRSFSAAAFALTLGGYACAEPAPPVHLTPARFAPPARVAPIQMQVRKARAPRVPTGIAIEIRDSAPQHGSQVSRFSLPLFDHGGSRVESEAADHVYKIDVHRDGDDVSSPIFFDLQRSQRGRDSHVNEAKLHAIVRMKPGQRVVIARIERSDGSRTEVVATLR